MLYQSYELRCATKSIARRTSKRILPYSRASLLQSPTSPLLTYFLLIIVYILIMEDSIILSPSAGLNYKPREMWKPLTRAIVYGMCQDGKSYSEMRKRTGLTRSIIQHIVKGVSSRITRKGKATKRPILEQVDIKRICGVRWIERSGDI
jgi:hypothetical protein